MWPYRPDRLTDLLDAREIARLLGQGPAIALRTDLTVLEIGPDGELHRIEASAGDSHLWEAPFAHFLRRGRVRGELAFDGAEKECRRHEAKLARRVLEGTTLADADGLWSARDPLGLLDFAAPIEIGGRVLAVLIGGRRVASDDDRVKIVKRVGKLGKLTQAEVRSLEASGEEPVAPIRPRDDGVRDLLLREIDAIPRVDDPLRKGLADFADLLSRLAKGRLRLGAQRREAMLLARVLPEDEPLPLERSAAIRWLQRTTRTIHEGLGVGFVAYFARLPEELDEDSTRVRLLAQSGLPPAESVDLRARLPALSVDVGSLPVGGKDTNERVTNGIGAVSRLIDAVRTSDRSPPRWKDQLTKALFVGAWAEHTGLEVVAVYGPPTEDRTPSDEDLALLWRLTRRVGERYVLGACESSRRRASSRLESFESDEKLRLIRKRSPLNPQRFDASKLVESCIESAAVAAAARRVTFDCKGVPERVMIEADRGKLQSAIDAVVAHATLNALPDDGNRPSVLVSIRRAKQQRGAYEIVFDLVGRYLSGEERRALFRDQQPPQSPQPPARAAEEGTDPESAAGGRISLREAQRIASLHNGRLQIESTRSVKREGTEDEWLGRTLVTLRVPEALSLRTLARSGDAKSRDSRGPQREGRGGTKPPRKRRERPSDRPPPSSD